jgi:hypothetical protein
LPYPPANGPQKGDGKPSPYTVCHYQRIRAQVSPTRISVKDATMIEEKPGMAVGP